MTRSAQNPLTLNRFLYANANPATLIDPNGHMSRNYYPDAEWTQELPSNGTVHKKNDTSPDEPVVPVVPVTPLNNVPCGARVAYCTNPDPLMGLSAEESVWESVPEFYVDGEGNGHVTWNEVKLSAASSDVRVNLSGSIGSLAKGQPTAVSGKLDLGLTVKFEKGGGSGSVELPLSLGSVGGGWNAGMITVPHTGGISAPGVDFKVSYSQSVKFSVAGSSVTAKATLTHHDLVIPGPDRYRDVAVADLTVLVIVVAAVFGPETVPFTSKAVCTATGKC